MSNASDSVVSPNVNAVISACLFVFSCKKIRRTNNNEDVPKSNGKDLDTIEYSYEHPVVADSTEQVITIFEVHL